MAERVRVRYAPGVLAKRIIPCLDVKDGRVVKGEKFVGLRAAGDPVEAARRYDAEGADEIAFLDITATHEGRGTLLDTVRRTADAVFTPLSVGGGVRSEDDIAAQLGAGADKVVINTAAVDDPALVRRAADRWGSQAIVVAIDAKRVDARPPASAASEGSSRASGDALERAAARRLAEDGAGASDRAAAPAWTIVTHGGRKDRGLDAVAWARAVVTAGAGEILLTSMDRDGTLAGYDLALVRAVAGAVPVPVIASGGVGELEHLRAGLVEGGADAALAASIFHDGKHTIGEAKAYLARRGVRLRLRDAEAAP